MTTSIQRLVHNYETDYLFDSAEIDAFTVMMKLLDGIDKNKITDADRFFLETETQELLTRPELRNQLHYIGMLSIFDSFARFLTRVTLLRTEKVSILESIIYPDLVELDEDCSIAQYLQELNDEPKPKETDESNVTTEKSVEIIETPMQT